MRFVGRSSHSPKWRASWHHVRVDDEEVQRQVREAYWGGLSRFAAVRGTDRVGLMSGGPHSVRRKLDELEALGVEGYVEERVRELGAPPTFSVSIWTSDLPRLSHTDPTVSPSGRAAFELDWAAHAETCRAERPWVELWWDDVPREQFEETLRVRMTLEQAQTLRQWVVTEEPTWRAIAAFARTEFSRVWGMDWFEPGHQGVGIAVAGVAASMFGETAFMPPWD